MRLHGDREPRQPQYGTTAGAGTRKVYLPKGAVWADCRTGTEYDSGQWVEADAPLEWTPVFMKKGADVNII